MRKYIILFFSALAILSACKSEVPPGIIPEQQMVSLLTDIHLTDGSTYSVPQVPDSLYKYSSARYAAVFKKHHTTSKVFDTSLKYYSKKPVQLTAIYEQISQILKGKVDSLDKQSRKPVPANPKAKNAVPSQ